ncbi:SpoIIE family protein phosphatase [Streptosporangium soli]|nr:SpoIIE family protein phosphatase [Streptosporangium sp. KLBMP 9127]
MTRTCGLGLEVFDPAPVGVAVTSGADHRLVYTNSAYRVMFGQRPLGVSMREAFSDIEGTEWLEQFDRVLATGEPEHVEEVSVRLAYPDVPRYERFFRFSLSRVALGEGEFGVLAVALNITEQVTATQRIEEIAEERRRVLQRYESLVRVGPTMVLLTDPEGNALEASPEWEATTGQTVTGFRGSGWEEVVHPDDLAATRESWYSAVREQTSLWEHILRLRMRDGSYRHHEVRAVPVRENDELIEWVATCSDIEEKWREDRRRDLLDRAAAATAGIVRLEEMLSALTRVIVPTVADACGIYLFPDAPDRPENAPLILDRAASAVREGLPSLPTHHAEHFAPESGLARAVRRRRAVRSTFKLGSPPRGVVHAGTESWMQAAEANSVVLLPVIVDGTVAAVVAAASCGDRPPISMSDVALMGQMFDHAHSPLSNALRFQRTQRISLSLQRSLLAHLPHIPDLEIVARYRASPSDAEVGGDWYDAFVLPDGAIMLTIGDVAGHDLPAAVNMGQLRNMLRGLAVDRQEPPGDILRRLDVAMDALRSERTATCVLARIEELEDGGRQAYYSVAGHPPPLLITADGKSRFMEDAPNPLLGMMPGSPRVSAIESLPAGATLLLYTDGLVEHPGEHLDDGLARLRRQAEYLVGESLDAFCENLVTNMATTGKDDIALIALRVPG